MPASNWLIPLVLFVVFASPMTFKAVRGVAGGWVASAEGQAKSLGLLLHGVIFVLAVGFLMKRVSFYTQPYAFGKGHETHQGDLGGGASHANIGGLVDGVDVGPDKQARFTLSAAPY
jgi:hypothetical protein